MHVVRPEQIPWINRMNVDGWPCQTRTFYENPEIDLRIRLIDYPPGSIEPRHVHPGMHAAVVLENKAIVDGLTLGPMDVIVGPSNEPHGPIDYPDGCRLLSAFQGSNFHSEVQRLSTEKSYRLVQHADIPWMPAASAGETKTLVDHGLGRLVVEVLRFPAGSRVETDFVAAFVLDGEASAGGEAIGTWDLIHADARDARTPLACKSSVTLLAFSMRDHNGGSSSTC